jgi:hypothetical protein
VALGNGLLSRVQTAIVAGDVFHRPQGHAVDGVGWLDAAVHGPVTDAAGQERIQLTHYHGAGTTVAFVATFLGAGAAQVFAQHL